MTALRLIPIILLLTATATPARPMLGENWPMVGFASDRDCELTLRSNPIAIRMDASGLIPGETLYVTIRNGAMKPLRAVMRANTDGHFSEYYAPLKSAYGVRNFGAPVTSGSDSGVVEIEIAAARCNLNASSPWSKVPRTIP